jgi:4-amino-4-deoxy-L-arabinose transferase-like glycosyltransferase
MDVGSAQRDSTPAKMVAALTRAVFGAVTVWTLYCIPYLNLSLALGDGIVPVIGAALIFAGLFGFALKFGPWLGRVISGLARMTAEAMGGALWIALLVMAGIAVRLVWMLLVDTHQSSDGATYFSLGRRILEQGQYLDPRGDRAYWPPGLPLWLYANFLVFGVQWWVPALGNAFFYGGAVYGTYRLGQAIATESVARLAALVLALWPNFLFSAGLASKELLVAAVLPFALLFHVRAGSPGANSGRSFRYALMSGACVGFASLAQPAVMLFPAVFVVDLVVRRVGVSRALVHLCAIALGMIVLIAPWTARNYVVFGQFVPIATNGGDVFYRANNPLATGGYVAMGEMDLRQYGELERDRIGFEIGKKWIRDNPGQFAVLGAKKQILFLGDDAFGLYETMKRDIGITTPLYASLKAVNNAFWLALWIMILASWRRDPSVWRSPGVVLLQLAFLYFLAIDTVFESSGRHHVPLLGVIALLGSLLAIPSGETLRDTSGIPIGDARTAT